MKCPNLHCKNGYVGNVGCAICKGAAPSPESGALRHETTEEDVIDAERGIFGGYNIPPKGESPVPDEDEIGRLVNALVRAEVHFATRDTSEPDSEGRGARTIVRAARALDEALAAVDRRFSTLERDAARMREVELGFAHRIEIGRQNIEAALARAKAADAEADRSGLLLLEVYRVATKMMPTGCTAQDALDDIRCLLEAEGFSQIAQSTYRARAALSPSGEPTTERRDNG
jgi:hypothetical protein